MTTSYAVEEIAVGIVTLAIGKTQATNKNGTHRLLVRSNEIYVGDIIETNQSAHLHIKFIDDGRISIRPDSRLHIESYQYDQQTPENSAIRFFLEQGVLRSISGKATEAAHDRYRMNTPVAALGVLGTDYVVKTSGEQTLAAVYSGGIALSPINQGCRNSGFGTCTSATVLTADMGNLYLEVNRGEVQSQLKNQNGIINKSLLKGEIRSSATRTSSTSTTTQTTTSDELKVTEYATPETRKTENSAQTIHNEPSQDMQSNELTPTVINADLASNAKLGTSTDLVSPQIIEPEPSIPEPSIPEPSIPEPSIPELSAFNWVRWPWQSAHSEDTVSQNTKANDTQKITIGNNYAGLFRNTTSDTLQRPDTGIYNFNLQRSHVLFIKPGESWQNATPASVGKAQLKIDFGQQKFNTQIDLSAPGQTAAQLNVQGNIDHNGLFRGNNGIDKAVGAISKSGNQAGMSFDKTIETGTFSGITEWNK